MLGPCGCDADSEVVEPEYGAAREECVACGDVIATWPQDDDPDGE